MTPTLNTAITSAGVSPITGIKLSVPDLFSEPAFQAWLNSSQAMTWHHRQGPVCEGDISDVAVFVDPSLSGEGTDTEMPGWDLVVEKLRAAIGSGPFSGNHFVVVLSNS
ncbi:hypothetical protein [Pseudomonas mosselii]|uniref:hypothetical protein n=1 Tax=Pseudomonas mosselii TaxID=78327 RepID=UPI0021D98913|nr:hypothetical protein [Pseudomonas mosselii]MCU9529371.1 hypothetical protein [Pseudomonas mosselii]MCU9536662.1 hypothetical protein [Pseudomonas mosselii]MCU9542283.1 hypothetical protein [Pseudomonas mosselii]MCU9548387.1 hypothetical protein [Pseudomonas mosselii]